MTVHAPGSGVLRCVRFALALLLLSSLLAFAPAAPAGATKEECPPSELTQAEVAQALKELLALAQQYKETDTLPSQEEIDAQLAKLFDLVGYFLTYAEQLEPAQAEVLLSQMAAALEQQGQGEADTAQDAAAGCVHGHGLTCLHGLGTSRQRHHAGPATGIHPQQRPQPQGTRVAREARHRVPCLPPPGRGRAGRYRVASARSSVRTLPIDQAASSWPTQVVTHGNPGHAARDGRRLSEPRVPEEEGAAVVAIRTGPINPSSPPEEPPEERSDEQSLGALRAGADDLGVVAVDVRRLAADLGTTTVQARALLTRLVRAGLLVKIGLGVHAVAGTPAAASPEVLGTPDEPDLAAPRTPPHRALHDGTGSPLLW
jgi:hypothetical protein